MHPTCDRCGRPLSADPSTPGAPAQATCTCERAPAMLAAANGPGKGAARDADPLPSAHEGNVEVDPWSVPPPEGGYENLDIELEPTGPQQPLPEAAAAEPPAPGAAPPDIASSIAARVEAEPEVPRSAARLPRTAIAAGAAVLLATAISAWLLLRGRDRSAPAGSLVRVTVIQEVPRNAPPPLAPIDPSYVESARREPSAGPKASPPTAPRHGVPPAAPRATAASAGATPTPPSPPAEIAPEPPPQLAPAAEGADTPLPPPPAIPVAQPPTATAAAAEPAARPLAAARAPVLQTRTCVADALRVPAALEGRLPPEVVLQVQVGEDGRAADVAFPGAIDPRLRAALSSAVRTCRFTPGADATGRPAAGRTTMRLRFEQ